MANLPATQTEPLDEPEILIRPATSEEVAEFVTPAWMQSYTRSLPGKMMRADGRFSAGRERYWTAMRGKIERILSTSTTSVRVAVVEDMPVAWVCDDQRQRILYFCYVKDPFRKQGLAGRLCQWAADANGGLVTIVFLPPPWFTRVDEAGHTPWPQHALIDLISAF
jgi:hypothetical protein